MGIRAFLWDKTLAIVFNGLGIIAVTVFLALTAGVMQASIVAIIWAVAFFSYLTIDYMLLRARINRAKRTVQGIEDKFLLGEVVEEPPRMCDRIYFELMVLQGRAAIERVREVEKQQELYYDYIQSWVHEIKIPITAIALICNRAENEETLEIGRQAGRIYDFVEQALYLARSAEIARDKMIMRCEPSRVIDECIKENKRYFIESGAHIHVDVYGEVFTDTKALAFIIKQLLYNSVQYARGDSADITISSRTSNGKYSLVVRDCGIGIRESDLPRIFDRGFTGSNGRRNRKSTGMGLYLCRRLCTALDIGLTAESELGKYTQMTLDFNISNR